jgi:hypothetical protein
MNGSNPDLWVFFLVVLLPLFALSALLAWWNLSKPTIVVFHRMMATMFLALSVLWGSDLRSRAGTDALQFALSIASAIMAVVHLWRARINSIKAQPEET